MLDRNPYWQEWATAQTPIMPAASSVKITALILRTCNLTTIACGRRSLVTNQGEVAWHFSWAIEFLALCLNNNNINCWITIHDMGILADAFYLGRLKVLRGSRIVLRGASIIQSNQGCGGSTTHRKNIALMKHDGCHFLSVSLITAMMLPSRMNNANSRALFTDF